MIKNLLLALLIGIAWGAAGGAFLADKIVTARYEKTIAAQKVQTAKAQTQINVTAQKAADQHQDAQQAIQARTQTVTKEIIKYVPKTVPGKCVLNRAAVGVLNHAARNTDPDSATDLAGAPETATDIGLQELSEHDAAISAQYNELSDQTNRLIDLVENYQRQTGANNGNADHP